MDGVQPKRFVGDAKVGNVEASDRTEPNEDPPAKRKRRNRKFIDLQKQPPRPKPLVQE
jgi:hypothetical protein